MNKKAVSLISLFSLGIGFFAGHFGSYTKTTEKEHTVLSENIQKTEDKEVQTHKITKVTVKKKNGDIITSEVIDNSTLNNAKKEDISTKKVVDKEKVVIKDPPFLMLSTQFLNAKISDPYINAQLGAGMWVGGIQYAPISKGWGASFGIKIPLGL